ncbi:hypothetical protein FRC08_016083 [Ceratobasidium sp. 394]|nr:hypothetical protein FRC08_016083 [Ceratobasidium sp. 394]
MRVENPGCCMNANVFGVAVYLVPHSLVNERRERMAIAQTRSLPASASCPSPREFLVAGFESHPCSGCYFEPGIRRICVYNDNYWANWVLWTVVTPASRVVWLFCRGDSNLDFVKHHTVDEERVESRRYTRLDQDRFFHFPMISNPRARLLLGPLFLQSILFPPPRAIPPPRYAALSPHLHDIPSVTTPVDAMSRVLASALVNNNLGLTSRLPKQDWWNESDRPQPPLNPASTSRGSS